MPSLIIIIINTLHRGSWWCHTAVSATTCWNTGLQFGAIGNDDSTDRLTDALWTQTPIALALFVVVGFFAGLPLRDKTMEGESNLHAAFRINFFFSHLLQCMWLKKKTKTNCAVTFLVLTGMFSSSKPDLAATLFFDAAGWAKEKKSTVKLQCHWGHFLELVF